MNNLIRDPEYADDARELRNALFRWIERTDRGEMLLKPDGRGPRFDHKYRKTY